MIQIGAQKQLALSLTIDQFREMDTMAIQNYALPIELLMENAGLQLARLVSSYVNRENEIWIGIGTGNNGGGGLVAARRLSGWGYLVNLDIPERNLKPLASLQLERALAVSWDAHAQRDVATEAFGDRARDLLLDVQSRAASSVEACLDHASAVARLTVVPIWTPFARFTTERASSTRRPIRSPSSVLCRCDARSPT